MTWSYSVNSRRELCRFLGWFLLANAALFCLIGLNLLWLMPMPGYVPAMTVRGEVAAFVFLISTYIGLYSFLSFLVGLPVLILVAIFPKRWFAFVLAIIVMAVAQMYLVVDSIIYHIYHFHMMGVVWHIIVSGAFSQVIVLSGIEYVILISILVVLLLLEVGVALMVWRKLQRVEKKTQGRLILVTIIALIFLSIVLFMNALRATSMRQLVVMSRHMIEMDAEAFPFYDSWLGPLVLGENGGNRLQSSNAGFFLQQRQIAHPLRYPIHPLVCQTNKKPLNIVIIGIDTWRYDAMNPQVTPNIYHFAKQSMEFHDHLSSGNCTRPGLFGLFYSIPPTYWTAAIEQHKGSLFIDTLMKHGYQMGVFMSASMHYPAVDQTIFLNLPNKIINTPGKDTYQRDEKITQEFQHFIKTRNPSKPFFSFLFYDLVHNYCGGLPPGPLPFKPYIKHCDRFAISQDTNQLPYINRYHNAAYFDDGLVARVLATIKKQGLLSNTVVIITSDHGESFNDHHDGYWGHASGFIKYQTQVPMIVHWPGMVARNIDYKTSHYDIVPTLLHKVLSCSSLTKDYSVGRSMFLAGKRRFIISASYIDYAILTNKEITEIYPQGTFSIMNLAGKIDTAAQLNVSIIRKVYFQLSKFFTMHH